MYHRFSFLSLGSPVAAPSAVLALALLLPLARAEIVPLPAAPANASSSASSPDEVGLPPAPELPAAQPTASQLLSSSICTAPGLCPDALAAASGFLDEALSLQESSPNTASLPISPATPALTTPSASASSLAPLSPAGPAPAAAVSSDLGQELLQDLTPETISPTSRTPGYESLFLLLAGSALGLAAALFCSTSYPTE